MLALVLAGAAWEALGESGGRPLSYRIAGAGLIELDAPIGKAVRRQQTLDRLLGGRRILLRGREAVLVSPGPRSSTGYAVRVLSVQQERRRVVVRVREVTPRLGDPVTARVTYPYALVMIPATGKPVTVQWQGR